MQNINLINPTLFSIIIITFLIEKLARRKNFNTKILNQEIIPCRTSLVELHVNKIKFLGAKFK